MSDNRDQFGRRFEGLADNILDSYIFMPKISLADVLGGLADHLDIIIYS